MVTSVVHVGITIDASSGEGREMLRGASDYARQRANWEIVLPCFESALGPVNVPYWCDGLLIRPLKPEDRKACLKFKGPMFGLVAAGLIDHGVSCLTSNGSQMTLQAFDHLRGLGLKRIGYVGYGGVGYSAIREQKFLIAAEEAKLEVDIYNVAAPLDRRKLIKWLEGWTAPFGIFAATDLLAREIINCAHEAGIRIPGEMCVVGAGNDEAICTMSSPTLTSVDPGAYQIGFEGARRLDLLMQGKKTNQFEMISPLGVVERESSDIRLQDPLIAQVLSVIRSDAPRGLSVADILDQFPISQSSLNRRFREATGRSPYEEIQRVRVERAKYLLRHSDLSNESIGEESGFPTTKAFYLAFRAATKLTPRSYRFQTG
ncbi:substrate-binding domain-containing protein [Cerasicoccus maritimus]|uniref:substrate-binding domain-containing protein n=1 Tax=Cerasicoccus maritimus TaxID=490089 RepID=UPI0028528613|nr:substrate-binding domain-containing protein [Cerasicoccus maritimus]